MPARLHGAGGFRWPRVGMHPDVAGIVAKAWLEEGACCRVESGWPRERRTSSTIGRMIPSPSVPIPVGEPEARCKNALEVLCCYGTRRIQFLQSCDCHRRISAVTTRWRRGKRRSFPYYFLPLRVHIILTFVKHGFRIIVILAPFCCQMFPSSYFLFWL